MNDQALEQQLREKGLDAPRVKAQEIDHLMSRVTYQGGRIGDTTSTVVHAFLDGVFLLASGHSSCVSPANFDAEIGFSLAKENAQDAARSELWKLEGYYLMKGIHRHKVEVARVCHEVNRAYCEALGDHSQPRWEEAPEWQRESARIGVDFHLMGNFGPEASHISWMNQKISEGWTYGPVKDPEKKTHPCLVPFDHLPKEQQVKDHLFRAVVHALSR